MINQEQLHKMSSVTVDTADVSELVDIHAVAVDTALPKELRIMQYIEDIKNPYCFRMGDKLVKTQFSASGLTLQNALINSAGH